MKLRNRLERLQVAVLCSSMVSLTSDDGLIYVGHWREGKQGEGQLFFPTGCAFHGFYENDQAFGYGELKAANGRLVFKGHWRADQPHGEGVYYFANGDVYHGQHDDGDYHGFGKFVSHDGTYYAGEWSRGRRTGLADFFDVKTGVLTQGIWRDDVFAEYQHHKVMTPPVEGFDPLPLEVGFDWTQHSGVKPHVCKGDHCHHSDDEEKSEQKHCEEKRCEHNQIDHSLCPEKETEVKAKDQIQEGCTGNHTH